MNMETIEKRELESLMELEEWPAISIYMPVSRIGDQQDSLRYKNCLAEVENKLINEGMRTSEVWQLLEPEHNLVKDTDYWKHLGAEGLAVFITSQTVVRHPLPLPVKELLTVGRRFNVRPLLPLLAGGQYLVLALSRNELRLFRGDRYKLKEMELPENTPKSMAEALKYDDPDRQLQYHTKTGLSRGQRDAMFHGHGMGFDDQNENLERYLQAVDHPLFPLLEDEKVPVILAGAEELHAAYRNISRSHTLLPRGIAGNVSELPPDTLHRKAWEIAEEYFKEEERQAVHNFRDKIGGSKVVDELQSVMTAAIDGRVENLFVAENEQLLGIFDADRRQVHVRQEDGADVVDLLDEAVFWTLNKKGTVYIRKHNDMPLDAVVCAQLRY